MNIYLPNNIYSSIFESIIPKSEEINILKKETALLANQLLRDESSIALIPSLELINHNEFFISSKFSFSFDGLLSYAYLYFTENEKSINKIFIRADVSINEIILTKILFAERYSIYPEITLDTSNKISPGNDYVVSGDENFTLWDVHHGISFADEISDLISLPYVNFLFASQNRNSLEYFNNLFTEVDAKIEDNIDNILQPLNYSDNVKSFIKENLGSIYFELTDNEIEALKELIKLVYYHEIIDDIFDLNLV
ncbi:hypothetical protein [Rosettibacter firmus]|uniref:hypothetical protein n=1 Tax=Rosettibacter firmus TaxID=3111522 RepID=UPI00336BEE73